MMFVCMEKNTHYILPHTQTNYPPKKYFLFCPDDLTHLVYVCVLKPSGLIFCCCCCSISLFIHKEKKGKKKISSNKRLLYNQCLLLLLLLTNISFLFLYFFPFLPPHLIFLYRDFRTFKPLEVDDNNNNDAVISVYT